MRYDPKNITDLVDYVTIDKSQIICYFRCKEKDKIVVSKVPFEPYKGKIKFTLKDLLFHPIESYNRYYHTPIVIYGDQYEETIVLKAFKNVSKYFKWNSEKKRYVYV